MTETLLMLYAMFAAAGTFALLSLLKGFDWEEATLMTLTAALLGVFRRSFYRPSRLTELPFSPLYLVASLCVLGASTWLLLFAYQDVPYSHQLWWQFTLDSDAPRGLRSLLGAAVLLVIVSLTWLLRTARPVIHLPDAAELETMVRTLREPYGRAAAMYLLDGLPVAAIAQKLGRPAPTVQNQLFRAKAILRKQIMERRQE